MVRKVNQRPIQQHVRFPFGTVDKSATQQVAAHVCKLYGTSWRSTTLPDDVNVGIEVEIERWTGAPVWNHADKHIWSAKSDGSLRNDGIEWVTTSPIPMSTAPSRLELLFAQKPEKAEFTDRCSIHVHLDVRDLTCQQIKNLQIAYLPVENLIFNFAGRWRAKDIFCVPLGDTVRTCQDIFIPDINEVHYLKRGSSKYAALNSGSVKGLGTLEFRHLEGTSDITRITNWLHIINCLYQWSIRHTEDEIVEIIGRLNTSSQYGGYLQEVFGEYAGLLFVDNLQEEMEANVTLVKLLSKLNPLANKTVAEESPLNKMWKKLSCKPEVGGVTMTFNVQATSGPIEYQPEYDPYPDEEEEE